MLDFRTGRVQDPVELQLDVLDQVTCELDMADVRWVVLGTDIVMLQHARGVEVGNERSRGLERRVGGVFDGVIKDRIEEVFGGVEVFVYLIDFRIELAILLIGVPYGTEASPKGLWTVSSVVIVRGNNLQ